MPSPESSSARRLVNNLSASVFARGSNAIHRIAIIPLLLWFLGPEQYGQWLVISAIPSWLSLSNFSLGSVAGNAISLAVARGDCVSARSLYSSTLAMITALSTIGMTMVLGVAWSISSTQGQTISSLAADSTMAILLLSASIFVSFFAEPFTTRLRAVGKAHLGIALSASLPWLESAFSLVALFFFSSLTSLAAATLLSRLAYCLIAWAGSRTAHPELFFRVSDVRAADIPMLLQKGVAYQAFPLGNAFVNQGMLLVVDAALGPRAVAVFGTARTLTRLATQLMDVINHSIWPEMSLLLGVGKLQQAQTVHRAAVASTLATGIASVVFAATIGPWLFDLWTLHTLSVSRALLILFSLSILGQSMWHASYFIHLAANKHEGVAVRYVGGAAVSLLLCYPLTKTWGLYGASLSTLAMDFCMIPYAVTAALQMTGDTLPEFVAGLIPAAKSGVQRARHHFRPS